MNVAQLREQLDEYGDHVEIAILVEDGNTEAVFRQFEVGFSSVIIDNAGNSMVTLEALNE